jgi:hypothetical protein
MNPVITVPFSQLSDTLPPGLTGYIAPEQWSQFKNKLFSSTRSANAKACCIEAAVCICFSLPCVFLCHPCIADPMKKQALRT